MVTEQQKTIEGEYREYRVPVKRRGESMTANWNG
jgi:hypothetical protein